MLESDFADTHGINFHSLWVNRQCQVRTDVWSEDPFSVKGENGLQIVMP